MKLYRYIVTHDTGFAPNPFHGYCTLATCKPTIRWKASVGDWVMGLGSKQIGYEYRVVYAMCVAETLTLDEYWQDCRFEQKRPRRSQRYEDTCGDNVYHRHESAGYWTRLPCFHCDDIANDTRTNRVLIANRFVYFGDDAQEIPNEFLGWGDRYFVGFRGHRVHDLRAGRKNSVIKWLESLCHDGGRLGDPAMQAEITGLR